MNTLIAIQRKDGSEDVTDDIKRNIQGTALSSSMLQAYCTLVMSQPDLKFDSLDAERLAELPPIAEHLETARANAKNFLDNINPRMWEVNTGIVGYANQFDAFYGSINEGIEKWAAGDATGKEDVIALLAELKNGVESKTNDAKEVLEEIKGFRSDLFDDAKNFNTDMMLVNAIMEGDEGVLEGYITSLNQMDDQIGGAIAGIAVSALGAVGGVVLIVVGGVASIPTGGATAPLIATGVVLVAAGVGGAVASSVILATTLKAKGDMIASQTKIEAEVVVLGDISSHLTQLVTAADGAISVVNGLVNSWTVLGQNLDNLLGNINRADEKQDVRIMVQAYINTAKIQWETVKNSALDIQNRFSDIETQKRDVLTREDIVMKVA
jgi:non-hemolytic enterotoxin B/C